MVALDFEPIPMDTRLTVLHQHFSSTELRDRHAWGWNGTLDKPERHALQLFGDRGHAAYPKTEIPEEGEHL